MKEINRGVIVVKPRLPFLEWVNSTGDDDVVLTLEEATRDSTAYLTPEIEDDEQLRKFLEENHELIFEQELVAWIQDEDQWPIIRNFSTFLEWFDTEFYSLVLDLAEGDLLVGDEA